MESLTQLPLPFGLEGKRCSSCHEIKPLSEFHNRKRSVDGKQANCKACGLIATRRGWEQRGREAYRAYHRDWKATHRDGIRASKQRRYEAHREEIIASVVAWRKANRDRWIEASKLWYRVNGKVAEYNHQYRARLRGVPCIPFTPAQLAAKIAYWGNRCWVCGGEPQAVDHVKPLAKGGPHCLANLRPICTSCNSHKRSKWPYVPERRT